MNHKLPRICGMTHKQWIIVRLVSDGLKNKDIAKLARTTEYTVKNHLRTILDVTGMNNRLELALWYVSRESEGRRYETQFVNFGIIDKSSAGAMSI